MIFFLSCCLSVFLIHFILLCIFSIFNIPLTANTDSIVWSLNWNSSVVNFVTNNIRLMCRHRRSHTTLMGINTSSHLTREDTNDERFFSFFSNLECSCCSKCMDACGGFKLIKILFYKGECVFGSLQSIYFFFLHSRSENDLLEKAPESIHFSSFDRNFYSSCCPVAPQMVSTRMTSINSIFVYQFLYLLLMRRN